MKIASIMQDTLIPLIKEAAKEADIEFSLYSNRALEASPELWENAISDLSNADLILLYRTNYQFWENIEEKIREIGNRTPIICVGTDASYWGLSTVSPGIVTTCYKYFLGDGKENIRRLMHYLLKEFGNDDHPVQPPVETPWQGIFHPKSDTKIYSDLNEFLDWYKPNPENPWVGVLVSRSTWISGEHDIDKSIVQDLEDEGCNVLPVFTNATGDAEIGALNIREVIDRYFINNGAFRINAIVKLTSYMIGPGSSQTAGEFLPGINVPVFQPVITSFATLNEWKEMHGLSSDLSWSIIMPEFEGIIEPVMLGSTRLNKDDDYRRTAIPDRSAKIAKRIRQWIRLSEKAAEDRKIVFVLNNNPCASVEANIGAGSHLDVAESVVRILHSMQKEGYGVSGIPENAKDLMDLFLKKKAISEFRWTTTSEIIRCGGILTLMDNDTYLRYFTTLTPNVRKKVNDTWGVPPGEGMISDGKILITGLPFGNAIVAVQPKRGCYGARCDGSVCKILHDPECPPTHQYLATYHYFSDIYGADAIVHVGTHGNMEFLPGKGTALSQECFPDIAVGNIPMLYIYNTDNPAEGVIAKRRVYAALIGHMQTVLTKGSLYEKYLQLDDLLVQYETARHDPARCHALEHVIKDAVEAANLTEIKTGPEVPIDEIIRQCHEVLSRIRNTQIQLGMHVFGEIPSGDKRIDLINSILRYDAGDSSPRRTVAKVFGLDFNQIVRNQDQFDSTFGMSNGALLEWLDEKVKICISASLPGKRIAWNEILGVPVPPESKEALNAFMDRVRDIDRRLDDSKEIESLRNAMSGGYVPPGPSGHITRGHDEILPTGRNFYSFDPGRLPTKAAWRVGKRLANLLVDKYVAESGKPPESVAFNWNSSDLLTSDGEMMAEIMALMGVEPVWKQNGSVNSYRIIPSDELSYPRIDITAKISGIMRDNFGDCIDFIDDIIRDVAKIDGEEDVNFVKKHVDEEISEYQTDFDDATARFFCCKPGVYTSSGVNLAVLAGAWKDEKDLAEIYIATNGYAYGGGRNGHAAHEQLASNLSHLDVTFNKVSSDETDLLGCCCYFGGHGGMTAAARHITGTKVKAYYGDTREPNNVQVTTLADEIRRIVRTKLLNPRWIEGMQEHGYKGASDIMKRITRVYGWEASTQEVDDWIFDDITRTFVTDPEMRKFFEDNNPYAIEEISRRLLEANSRGLWEPDEQLLDELRSSYLEIESWLEDLAGEGEFQGGSVDVVTAAEIEGWGNEIESVMKKIHGRKK